MRIDQAAVGRISVKDEGPDLIKIDDLVQLRPKSGIPALNIEVEIVVVRSELHEIPKMLGDRCRL